MVNTDENKKRIEALFAEITERREARDEAQRLVRDLDAEISSAEDEIEVLNERVYWAAFA